MTVDPTPRLKRAARAREVGGGMLVEAVERSRPRLIAERLQANFGWIAQAALATAAAWVLAQQLFGHERPIFAPVAALIGVSVSLGRRRRATFETIVGIALGIGIADALFVLIGDGPLQIAAVVTLAMMAAVVLGGSVVLVSEAAASALLVVTIQPPGSGLSGVRFVDSLLGGLVALAVTSMLPRNPVVAVRQAVAPLLEEMAATLDDVAWALDRRDREMADRAHQRARALHPAELVDAVAAGREMLRLAPYFRGTRAQFERYATAAAEIDTAVTSVEALCRGAVRALALSDNVPPPVPDATRDLARAVRTLDDYLADPAGQPMVSDPALRAAAHATLVLEQTHNLSVSVIVAQVRASAVDLIRAWGVSRADAEKLVREVAESLATGEREALAPPDAPDPGPGRPAAAPGAGLMPPAAAPESGLAPRRDFS